MTKIKSIIFISILILGFYLFAGLDYFTFENLNARLLDFEEFYAANFLLTILIASFIYIFVTTVSLPIASTLTILYGILFDVYIGTLIVIVSGTIGVFLLFNIINYFFKDYVQKKFSKQLKRLKLKIDYDGINAEVFFLRAAPIFPFWMLNLILPLLPIKLIQYTFISFLGMLPGTFIFVYLGSTLDSLMSAKDLISIEIILAVLLISTFPLIIKFIHKRYNKSAV